MATHTWTQTAPIPHATFTSPAAETRSWQVHDWIEKYRAALLEVDPQVRLRKILEADASFQCDTRRVDPREKSAIDEARKILTVLREGIERRVGSPSWLL
jgi:hypothetical protein